jgi:hypothetical protein
MVRIGWHQYTADGAKEAEGLWLTFQSNPTMHQRVVTSDRFDFQ